MEQKKLLEVNNEDRYQLQQQVSELKAEASKLKHCVPSQPTAASNSKKRIPMEVSIS